MNDESSLFGRALEDEFFLKGEYLKRHFEDTASTEEINWLKENCFSQHGLKNFVLSDKIVIIRECIFKRDKETKGEKYIPNIEIPIHTNRKWVDRLHKISSKYKVYAPELLIPYDFVDIIKKIGAGGSPPQARLFEDEPNAEYTYNQYGYRCSTAQQGTSKNLIIEIHFSSEHELQQDIIQRISSEIAMFKKTNCLEINGSDVEYLKIVSAQDKSKKFRSNSLHNRSMGIYAWDTVKEFDDTLEGARKKIIQLGLYKYNKKICNIDDCMSCESKDNCRDAFENNYKIAAASIEQQAVVPTSQKIKKMKPARSGLTITRKPTNYLENNEY